MDRSIIRLEEHQLEPAAQTLAIAFHHDPAMVWMMPDEKARRRGLLRLTRWMVGEHLANGLVLGTPGCEVVTLWRPPGAMHLKEPLWHPGTLRFVPIFGWNIWKAAVLDDAIHRHLPPEEAWLYLRMAGVRPDCQGKGLGGAAIRAGLAGATHNGAPAILETATASNVSLYRRLGFAVAREWKVSCGGPKFWTMTHEG